MATIVREIQVSRSVEKTEEGRRIGPRIFNVYDDTTPNNFANGAQVKALYGTPSSPDAMPNYYFIHPDDPTLVALTDRIELVDGSLKIWQVTWNYKNITVVITGPGPEEIGYVEFNLLQRREFDEVWRDESEAEFTSFPTGGNVSNTNIINIGGTPVDVSGEPGTRLRLQQALEISEVVSMQDFSALSNMYSTFVGTRNSAPFYGGATGKVLYESANSRRIDIGLVSVSHRFVWDEWYHLKQVPARGPDGIVGPLFPGPPHSVMAVYWRQPFPKLSNFGALSTNF